MKLLSGPLYFIIKLGIIAASVVILVYLSRTKIIRDSKSEIKDNVEKLSISNNSNNSLEQSNADNSNNSLEQSNADNSNNSLEQSNADYNKELLKFYDILVQSNITAIITIILFFGGMALTYFTKIKIRIKFIIKLIMIGLLISFIIISSNIDYVLNVEIYTNKEFVTYRTLMNELINKYNKDNKYKEVVGKLKDLLSILDICRTTGYISFSLMIFLLVTEIYK